MAQGTKRCNATAHGDLGDANNLPRTLRTKPISAVEGIPGAPDREIVYLEGIRRERAGAKGPAA
jgi:hypothetical protein